MIRGAVREAVRTPNQNLKPAVSAGLFDFRISAQSTRFSKEIIIS
jgi:hypothetical protein